GAVSPVELVRCGGSGGVPRDSGGGVRVGLQEGCSRLGLAAFRVLVALSLFSGLAGAAPKLRLTASTLGPLSIAQGANGATQTVEAYNAGDGSLSLTPTTPVSWITVTVGVQRACTSPRTGVCT